jgi:hypothetical protein
LATGIQAWPKNIENIAFVQQTDDFAIPGFKNKLEPKRGDETADLATGYLPTRNDMDTFLAKIRKSRPDLKQFSLTIYVRNPDFGSRMTQKLFECCHSYETKKPKGKKANSTSVTDAKTTVGPAKPNVFHVNQSIVERLHEISIENLEDFGSDFDQDELEEEMEMEMQFREQYADEDDY